jgi:hypothetical protein|uniref:Uncharacterized protein n=1 Tax=Zea mays TaxID=4577 RepID=A0A804LIJ5_MAIZE
MCGADGDSVCASLSGAWVETAAPIKADVLFHTLRYGVLYSIHPTQGTQFRGPRDAPSRAQRTPSRRRSVGQSAPAPKLARQGPGGEPPGRGPGRHRPSHPTLRCPALPVGVMSSSPFHSVPRRVFSRFTGTRKPAGCRASGWPLGPSVRPSAAAPCRQEHIHSPAVGACMRADSPRPGRILT